MLNIISDVIYDVIDNMFTSKGFHRAGNKTVLEVTGFSYCSEGWT